MTGGSEGPLSEELGEFIAAGVDVYVGTRDRELEPESMFAMGIRVHEDRRQLTVYLPEKLSAITRRNLEANGEIAITLERPSDLKGFQIKGRMLRIRPSTELDRQFQNIFRAALVEQFESVGIPRSTTRRINYWPSLAVEVEARDVFLQTPGPKAGEPL